jgi:singapore isolate B (sub-type 7) whole genome shotgun sequence assembly, scaffold_4
MDTQQKAVDLLGFIYLPDRVTTLVYSVQSSEFPINLLRNLGIRNVETSHFIVLDMDLMLSRNLLSELKKLPTFLKESNNSAVIIPLFFLSRDKILPYCSLLEDCLPL